MASMISLVTGASSRTWSGPFRPDRRFPLSRSDIPILRLALAAVSIVVFAGGDRRESPKMCQSAAYLLSRGCRTVLRRHAVPRGKGPVRLAGRRACFQYGDLLVAKYALPFFQLNSRSSEFHRPLPSRAGNRTGQRDRATACLCATLAGVRPQRSNGSSDRITVPATIRLPSPVACNPSCCI